VIDTPGILDHPLDQRNTIEMQAITALAHLNAAILFLLDISETCGYTIQQQIDLFNSIKPLFQAKPLVIVLTKIDLKKFNEVDSASKKAVENLAKEANAYLIQMSNISGDGINDVKSKACDILLDYRLTQKSKDPKKEQGILNRLHITEPKKRDNIDRPAIIPESVVRGDKKTGKSVKELQEEFGGAGVFYIPVEEHYMLENDEWRYDNFPEIYNGSNVLDFYDADIERKLKALEDEEDELLKMEAAEDQLMEDSDNSDGITFDDLKKSLKEVRSKKALKKMEHRLKITKSVRPKNAKLSEIVEKMEAKGIEVNKETLKTRSKSRKTIAELEKAADERAKKVLEDSDSDGEVVDNASMASDEQKERGRKRRRNKSVDSDDYMDVDEQRGKPKSSGKRSMTPA
jgi:nucleolar GTP-binding protein